MIKNRKNLQRGFVSIETMMVFAIVAIAIAMAIYFINMLVQNNRGKDEVANIGLVKQKVTELFSQDASYAGLSDEVLIKAGVLNKAMISGTKLVNQWKSNFTVEPTGTGNNTFTITTEKIPDSQCTNIVNAYRKQVVNLTVNGTSIVENSADKGIAVLTSACANAENTVKFEFL